MKKTLLYNILFFCLILSLKTFSQEQILVQKEWLSSTGTLDTIPYSATAMDSHGNLIVVGNTLYTGQVNNILITKYDDEGAIIWERQINGQDNGKDFGTGLYIDTDNNIFVTGVIFSDVTNYDYIIAKYAPNGNLYWTQLFNGAGNNYDLPVAITGNSNFCYVTGTSFSSTSLTDFATLQLNADDGTINWVRTYNYSNGYELPVGLVLDSLGNVFVTGASASSFNNWDIATIEYDATGDEINVNRSQNSINGFDKPFDIKKDYNGNIYVVGRTLTSSNTYDIKLLKFNSNLNLQWIRNFDGFSSDDEPSKIEVDLQGNIVIVGYTKLDNKRKILTVKYDPTGNLLWQKVADFTNSSGNNTATAVAIAPIGTVTVVGEYKYGANSEVFVLNYSASGEEEWSTQFENAGENHVAAINLDSTGNVYVNTSLVNNTVMQNGIIKYVTLKKPFYNVLSNTGKPLFSNNQFIVRFGSHVVNKEAIDNNGKPQEALFGTLERFVIPAVATEIKATLRTTKDIHLIKIFPYDLSSDTLDISNNGNQVRIPEFYCTFVMLLPDSTNIFEKMAALDSLFPSVIFTEPDYFIEGLEGYSQVSEPNYTPPTPPSYCYDQFPINPISLSSDVGINVDSAWNFTMGKQHVRVGVFDDGIQWNRSEFQKLGEAPFQGDTATSHVYGYDFVNESNLKVPNPTPGGGGRHGSAVASVIAANNGNGGMMGIAGGCSNEGIDELFWDGPKYNGVKLFAVKIYNGSNFSDLPNPISHINSAIKYTSNQNSTNLNPNFNYKLNIQNHSWKIIAAANNEFFTSENTQLLTESIHYINRLGVTFVASRGNEGTQIFQLPACLDTTWITCVGGTGADGNYYAGGQIGNQTVSGSSYGIQLDISAPAAPITVSVSQNNPSEYEYFSGTSAAAPNVTGVAALLMSYLNNPDVVASNDNLAPEDIEWILRNSATDVGSQGYDIFTGAGRLNAGAAMQLVNKFDKKLFHFSNEGLSFENVPLGNFQVYLKEPYLVSQGIYNNPGWYNVYINKNTSIVNFDTQNFKNILGIWPLHSETELFGLPQNDSLSLSQRCRVTLLNDSTAKVEGYFYVVSNLQNNFLNRWPANNFRKMAFSVLAQDVLASVSNKKLTNTNISVFPNPTTSKTNLSITLTKSELININLFDSKGQLIKGIKSGLLNSGTNIIEIETANLESGLYFISVGNSTGENNNLKLSVIK
jgi:hypothetical protein